jgi:hypothetical protein
MPVVANKEWSLESFIDSLVLELDKAREILAVKAINRPLTYTVKDVGLDLNLFPTYDGDEVKFVTAQPGQTGASKLSIQLGSITDQQIRLTSKEPITKDNISIEAIDIDPETKRSLRKIGVSSVSDLEKIEKKNVDLEKVGTKKVNYKNLAESINKSKRGNLSCIDGFAPECLRRGGRDHDRSGEPRQVRRQISREAGREILLTGVVAEIVKGQDDNGWRPFGCWSMARTEPPPTSSERRCQHPYGTDRSEHHGMARPAEAGWPAGQRWGRVIGC